ncbi:MAG: YifB family Mg chelatase-like AAA ATPase [Candidatus Caenarcaniphilales bacterium]|nr:YifB family Mg chelatase-like AAA ATPase [Candidatus Caenarcaniphilales bacterium]
MYSKSFSAMLLGVSVKLIDVEVDISGGLPQFQIIGLASKAIAEAKQRVAVAMQSSGFELVPKKILVNLCPADMKKEGPQFDLAIAALLLKNFNYVKATANFFSNSCFIAELTLTGDLKKVKGLMSFILDSVKLGVKNIFLAKEAEADLQILKDHPELLKETNLYLVKDLKELVTALNDQAVLERFSIKNSRCSDNQQENNSKDINSDQVLFEDIIGQSQAKRALEIAVAGRHNLLMVGPPGCGKSLLAKAVKSIVPKLSVEKALETQRIRELASFSDFNQDILDIPYRAPHNSCSPVSLVGGSIPVTPGEVSLAHNGILFLDELAEFNRFTLDQLRVILDNKKVALNKGIYKYEYPADFILIAATNPCPCGYYGDLKRNCICSMKQIQRYISKISGPLLDRIDIVIHLKRLDTKERELLSKASSGITKSSDILQKIEKVKEFTKKTNLDSSLDKESRDLLARAVESFDLSARAHTKLIKLARTIANLDFSKNIKQEHLAEAIQYREDFHI